MFGNNGLTSLTEKLCIHEICLDIFNLKLYFRAVLGPQPNWMEGEDIPHISPASVHV